MTFILAAKFPYGGGAIIADQQLTHYQGTIDLYKSLTYNKLSSHEKWGDYMVVGHAGDFHFGQYAFAAMQISSDDDHSAISAAFIQNVLSQARTDYEQSIKPGAAAQEATKSASFLTLIKSQDHFKLNSYKGDSVSNHVSYGAIGSGSWVGEQAFIDERRRLSRLGIDRNRYSTLSAMLIAQHTACNQDMYCGGQPNLILGIEKLFSPAVSQVILAMRVALARKHRLLTFYDEVESLDGLLFENKDPLEVEDVILQSRTGLNLRRLKCILRGLES